jgi:ubiquitin thioesterase protein OTUB1
VASSKIRDDPDEYAPFLFHPEIGEPMSTRDFCEHFVEAVGKEAGPWLLVSALSLNLSRAAMVLQTMFR